MKNIIKYLLLCTFGGYTYVCLELLYRGRSDITMMFCASIIVLLLCSLNNIFGYSTDFLLQILICMLFGTGIEWVFGITFNRDFSIWDYRNMPFHSPDAQVCLPFTLLWGLISAIVIPLMDFIDWKIFGYKPDTPPYYVIGGKLIYQMGGGEKKNVHNNHE